MNRRTFTLSLPGALFVAGCSRSAKAIVATGTAFGTEISVTLPESAGTKIFDGVFAEIARLEAMFTLFDPDSPLRQLNRTGRLENPGTEWIELLTVCERVHQLSGGAFDPTVQSLWELYERHFAENPTDERGPEGKAIAEARSRIGWEKVDWSRVEIRFRHPGMALTLNGIAPGFVADRAVAWLGSKGLHHALVNTGEFCAIGPQPDGAPWPIDIRGSEGEIVGTAELDGIALATSAGYATAFDLERQFHHLFHPQRDSFQPARRTIAVEAPTAALADALATAGGVMEPAAFADAVREIPGVSSRVFG